MLIQYTSTKKIPYYAYIEADISDYRLSEECAREDARIYVAPSKVCDGLGVFAAHDISRHTPLTAYKGAHLQSQTYAHDYALSISNGKKVIDGSRQGRTIWTKYGYAQMANDAIHPEVTQWTNNAYFHEVTVTVGTRKNIPRVFLVSKRDIKKDEEILVAYALPYWFHKAYRTEHTLSQHILQWLEPHYDISCLLRRGAFQIKNYEKKITDHDIMLDFYLGEDATKRKKYQICFPEKIKLCRSQTQCPQSCALHSVNVFIEKKTEDSCVISCAFCEDKPSIEE